MNKLLLKATALSIALFGAIGVQTFTSCSGDDGSDGAPGVQGEPGAPGAAGAQGLQGEPGTDGVTPVCNPTTKKWEGTEIICVAGEVGSQGEPGEPGEDGVSCDVEEDGAFFVMKCGEDVKARWAKAYCGTVAYDPETKVCVGSTFTKFIEGGKEYNVAKIGDLYWMTDDLVKSPDNKFNWTEAMEACPAGWKLPSKDEVEEVEDEILQHIAAEIEYWTSDEENADKSYAFVKLPSGNLDMSSYAKGSLKYIRCIKD